MGCFSCVKKWRKDSSDQNEFTLIPDESVGSDEGDAPAGSSMVAISFNFINSIIGSGLIGMPFALQQAGLGIGVLIFLVVGVAADYSVMLLINAGDLSGTRSYQELMDVTFGRPGFYGVTVLQFLLPFLATVSYNVVIGDAITKVLTRLAGAHLVDTPFSHRQFLIVFVTLTVTLPLSLYRDVGKLGKWSGLSLIFTLFNIFVVFFRLGTSSYISPTVDAYDISHSNMSQALGLVGLGIVCHHNSFVLYSSLDRPTPARWRVVTHVSEFAATLLMLVFALGGYLTFTGYTQGDILENFCSGDDLGNMARLAFAVIVMMTFPLDCFVAREVLENALSYGSKSVGPTSLQRHVLLTILLVSAITAVSMVTDCVGIVMELNGVLVASPLAFMIPAICMIRLRPHGIFCAANIGPLITFFFGLLLSTAGLATVSMEIYKGVSCSHGKEMPYCPAQHTLPSHTSETGLQR